MEAPKEATSGLCDKQNRQSGRALPGCPGSTPYLPSAVWNFWRQRPESMDVSVLILGLNAKVILDLILQE
jgi:hypothetical protein